jgi:NADH:ubiquinone oxidoreductase subunit F (NADH-binding)/ferredoxin
MSLQHRVGPHHSVQVDPSRCDGQGVCALLAPSVFKLDRYGDAYVDYASGDGDEDAALSADLAEAATMCPRSAITVARVAELAASGSASAHDATAFPAHSGAKQLPSRLMLLPGIIEAADWCEQGGPHTRVPSDIGVDVVSAGLLGEGGAGYPVGEKWRRFAGGIDSVVVANGAECEPGTLKDSYLLENRPHLVLEGMRLVTRHFGSGTAIIALDAENVLGRQSMAAAVTAEERSGRWQDVRIALRTVPPAYVAGEETALIASLQGGRPRPSVRPPYPATLGLDGRPTLIHNVTTLAQIALIAGNGPAWFREFGTADEPGTGLYSVGRFGGRVDLFERPIGYSLRTLLDEADLLTGARAVLVGGWSGGLLPASEFDVSLSAHELNFRGSTLGTKSVQVVDESTCPVSVVVTVMKYMARSTATQCRPCHRGLPDLRDVFERLEYGVAERDEVMDAIAFASTLPGRGICSLPDGPARLISSLRAYFGTEIEDHLRAEMDPH